MNCWTRFSLIQRSRASIPLPFNADTCTDGSVAAAPVKHGGSTPRRRSTLFRARARGSPPGPISWSTCSTASTWRCIIGLDASTTWTSRSASATSSSVARKAATSVVGNRCTKPTVSVSKNSCPPASRMRRVVGSSVAKSLSSASTPDPASAFSSVDLPALVYPTRATTGAPTFLHRERRKNVGAPVVALVGYTNAGKSTLLNTLAGSGVLAEDKLFATLDPTTRRIRLAGGQEFLLTDTVGFVQRLPTTVVAAFRATLGEVAEADLLVHVVDAASPAMQRQVEAVEQVLGEIGAAGRPVIVALNKVDLRHGVELPCLTGTAATLPSVQVSALQGSGIDALLRCISENLLRQFIALDVRVPYDRGDLVALFHKYGVIEHESYEESSVHLCGSLPQNQSGPFLAFPKKKLAKRQR